MKTRVADYVAQRISSYGIRHVFMVTGGGAMHLNDAIGRCRGLDWICCHHEQACAMAAQAYFRVGGRLAAVNVTTGPGGTNAITGVFGAWVDSEAMLVLSGQVKWETVVRSTGLPLRQMGDQELDITRIVAPITKYAAMVTEASTIRYHLERALYLACSGRPGPAWLDIPLNVQAALVEPDDLPAYEPSDDAITYETDLDTAIERLVQRVAAAKRPVILPGSGIRIAGAYAEFLNLVDALGVPVTTAFNAHDLLPDDHPLYVGRPGTVGDRAGNFAVQNADLLLVLGCRLNVRQIGYDHASFARAAYKVMVDIDANELRKPSLRLDLPIHADLRAFLQRLLPHASRMRRPEHADYLAWCKGRQVRYPVVLPQYSERPQPVNPYVFAARLFAHLPDDAIVVTANGAACVVTFQAAQIRGSQRLFSDSGSAPMGFDLPAAIGACVAAGRRRVVCLAGDGSIMMNLQELQTIATHHLPISIFVHNNGGYHSIRQTQQAYFPDNFVGFDAASGVGFPDFGKIAAGFGMPYRRVDSHAGLDLAIEQTLGEPGSCLCEVVLDPTQAFCPKSASRRLADGQMVSSPLEDLAPFLPREELQNNLLIPPLDSAKDR
jgi:acetolactate synthase-1/2/3 large subunit